VASRNILKCGDGTACRMTCVPCERRPRILVRKHDDDPVKSYYIVGSVLEWVSSHTHKTWFKSNKSGRCRKLSTCNTAERIRQALSLFGNKLERERRAMCAYSEYSRCRSQTKYQQLSHTQFPKISPSAFFGALLCFCPQEKWVGIPAVVLTPEVGQNSCAPR
jgi:hypothetical protein